MQKIFFFFVFLCLQGQLYAQDFYKHLVGQLGSAEITMELSRNANQMKGTYYYNKYALPILITGESKNGVISLKEKSGTFEGKIVGNTFSGTWKGNGKNLEFKLSEDYTKSVQFQVYSYEESQKLYKDSKDSPTATLRLSFLQATAFADKNVLNQIQSTTDKAFFGTTTGTKPTEKIANVRKSYFQEYLDTYKSEKKADVMGMISNYTQERSQEFYVLFNERPLLSLAMATYEFAGGAHGQYASTFYVFDLKTGKKLGLNDIFVAGYDKTLPSLMEAEFRKERDIKGSLTDYGLFVDKLPMTENFYIDKAGVNFVYGTYEIAPYAAGEITIVVPFAKLKKLLKANTALSEMAN